MKQRFAPVSSRQKPARANHSLNDHEALLFVTASQKERSIEIMLWPSAGLLNGIDPLNKELMLATSRPIQTPNRRLPPLRFAYRDLTG
jgi:hypothetical protein